MRKKRREFGELKISVFLSRPFWFSFFKIFFFASSPWKPVNIYNVARMGRNFADYPGLQQKSKWAHISLTIWSSLILYHILMWSYLFFHSKNFMFWKLKWDLDLDVEDIRVQSGIIIEIRRSHWTRFCYHACFYSAIVGAYYWSTSDTIAWTYQWISQ